MYHRAATNQFLRQLTAANRADPAVRHALDVRQALAQADYHSFFRLYLRTPNMGAYMLDHMVERERVHALRIMCRAYRPALSVRFVANELAFVTLPTDDDDGQKSVDEKIEEGVAECRAFIQRLVVDTLDLPEVEEGDRKAARQRERAIQSAMAGIYIQGGENANSEDLDCKQLYPIVVQASQKFDKVDIKGQI